MDVDLDRVEDDPFLTSQSEDSNEVVAVSPVLRRLLLGAVAVFGVVIAVTLVASIFDGEPAEESAPEDSSLIIATTTSQPLATSTTDQIGTTTTLTTAAPQTTIPVGPSEQFTQFPTNSQLVLWTYNERSVVVVDVDAATSTELDLTEFGVPLVERIIGVGENLVVQSLGDYHAIDLETGSDVLLSAQGEVQAFGDNEIWMTDSFVGDEPTAPTRIDLTAERRVLPEVPAGVYPFGWVDNRLLVGAGASGGVYIESGDSYEKIVDGEMLASGGGYLLTRVCDAALDCTVLRVEIATGETTQHVPPDGFAIGALFWIDRPAAPNVDAVLGRSSELGTPAIWDLLTDELIPIALEPGRGAAWSPDGSWVFASVGDNLVAYNRANQIEVVFPVPATVDFASALQLSVLPLASAR